MQRPRRPRGPSGGGQGPFPRRRIWYVAGAAVLVAFAVLGWLKPLTVHVEAPDGDVLSGSTADAVVGEAMAYWSDHGHTLWRVDNEWLGNTDVRFVHNLTGFAAGDHYGIEHRAGGAVRVGLGHTLCGEWQPYTRGQMVQIATHELGHALGYGHDDQDTHPVMGKLPVSC